MNECVICDKRADEGQFLCSVCLIDAEKISFETKKSEEDMVPLDEVPMRGAFACPRCGPPMIFRVHERYFVEMCTECSGLWYSREAFQNSVDRTVLVPFSERQTKVLRGATRRILLSEPKPQSEESLPCPKCKSAMLKSNFGKTSDVVIDICPEHGVWFDKNELAGILHFISHGGIEDEQFRGELGEDEEQVLRGLNCQTRALSSLKRNVDQEIFAAMILGCML